MERTISHLVHPLAWAGWFLQPRPLVRQDGSLRAKHSALLLLVFSSSSEKLPDRTGWKEQHLLANMRLQLRAKPGKRTELSTQRFI